MFERVPKSRLAMLALVFLLFLFSLPARVCTLVITVKNQPIRTVDVLHESQILATVTFGVLPNEHTFNLPVGDYELIFVDESGDSKRVYVQLEDDKTINF